MKVKSFCTMKEIVSKLKRLPIEMEKIFSSNTSDKGLITRTYLIYLIHFWNFCRCCNVLPPSTKIQNKPMGQNILNNKYASKEYYW
jgi:hypothetical protein